MALNHAFVTHHTTFENQLPRTIRTLSEGEFALGKTIIEKIIESHSNQKVAPGEIVDIRIDLRVARDFGGANVVRHLREHSLPIDDPKKTFFTFDCNPTGSDQKYATNQQLCRLFAREQGIKVYDLPGGIGTHLVIEEGLVKPGDTFVSTDSHANILGAIGAFGQGMGDQDIAAAWSSGSVWFKVPPTQKIILKGTPGAFATAKDITLAILKKTGANGLLGSAAEFYGQIVPRLGLAERITIASMNTEMGGIISLFPPNAEVLDYFNRLKKEPAEGVYADENADYQRVAEIDVDGLEPQISRPGHPEDVVPVRAVAGKKIDSVFIGSCTNGRFVDLAAAAKILKRRKVAPGVVLKVVPATDKVWQQCLRAGLWDIFKRAGALIGNAGCAGCANGQIGQNGPGEVTVSTGNRNFVGKQGQGEVYLASPSTAVASAIAGQICTADKIPDRPKLFATGWAPSTVKSDLNSTETTAVPIRPTRIKGRVWVIQKDNIDTDMIYHNRYLAITDVKKMGQYTLDNLKGWENFAQQAQPGDIVVTGKNFGAGSSRQQAVDCFKSLGIALIIAESFGAIYERNAMNAGFPILTAPLVHSGIQNGEHIQVDFETGTIICLKDNSTIQGNPFPEVQQKIYQRGGLLAPPLNEPTNI